MHSNQNKNHPVNILTSLTLAICLGTLLITGLVQLVSPTQVLADGNRGLIVSPLIVETTVPQDQKTRESIRLENDGNSPLELKAYINKVSIDEQNNPLLEQVEEDNPLNQLILLSSTSISLKPKEVKNFDFVINQVKGIPVGNLAAIVFEPVTKDDLMNGVNIKQRLSTLVFVQTPQKEGEPTPKFQIVNSKADLTVIDPFLDNYNLSYQVYNPTPKFIKVYPVLNQVPSDQSPGQKIILPFGTRTINISNSSPIQLPMWIQKLLNPRFDYDKVTNKQNLTESKIIGEQIWNFDNDQKEVTQVKVWFFPWKSGLIVVILLALLITLYYVFLWILTKIKINGKELHPSSHISKRLPVIICFSAAFISLMILIVTQMLIPRVDVYEKKFETDLTSIQITNNELILNGNYLTLSVIVDHGFKTNIEPKLISIDDINCQTPELPAKANGCYLGFNLSKVSLPKDTTPKSLIIGNMVTKNLQVIAKSKVSQEINLEVTNKEYAESNTVSIDLSNPNLDLNQPLEIRFWQIDKKPIQINNIVITYQPK